MVGKISSQPLDRGAIPEPSKTPNPQRTAADPPTEFRVGQTGAAPMSAVTSASAPLADSPTLSSVARGREAGAPIDEVRRDAVGAELRRAFDETIDPSLIAAVDQKVADSLPLSELFGRILKG
jgi:hypothetical protein